MIGDDHAARTEEACAREGDEGPCRRKVLQVDEVGGDGEEDEEERKAVDQVEGDVEGDDGLQRCQLYASPPGCVQTHIDGTNAYRLCRLGMLLYELGKPEQSAR